MGKINSRAKGIRFEQQVAHDLRSIYDPPELLAEYSAANSIQKKAVLKRSHVRRSDQGKGALEPDLVVQGSPFWMELQHANAGNYDPIAKLEQAERDVRQTSSKLWPVSICHCSGAHGSVVCMRGHTFWSFLAEFGGGDPFFRAPDVYMGFCLYLAYTDFMELLTKHHKISVENDR